MPNTARFLLDKVGNSRLRVSADKMDALARIYSLAVILSKGFSAHSATIDRLASDAVRGK